MKRDRRNGNVKLSTLANKVSNDCVKNMVDKLNALVGKCAWVIGKRKY